MDLENILTGTKWDIVKIISKKPSSPLEIAKELNTSAANISQQIRLLETAGLIDKKKTGSSKPGKPRTLFSIKEDFAFIISVSDGSAEKKLVMLDSRKKEILKKIVR